MNGEAGKLHLIEALLKVNDEKLLEEIEALMARRQRKAIEKKGFVELTGTLTDEEADKWLKNIEEGCEQINPNDWK